MTLDLSQPRRLYFIGLGGIGMSALARFLAARGHAIAGSDQAESALLAQLRAEGITAYASHDAGHLEASRAEAVVVSAAVRPANVELRAAQAAGLPVLTLAEAVGRVASQFSTIAVAGTHGKTTTSSMVAYALDRAGRAPSFLLGGIAHDLGGNARASEGDLLVIEADEYAGRFLTLQPDLAVVTTLEHDHPDCYPDWASLEATFRRWLAQVRPGGLVLLRADDAGCQRLQQGLTLAPGVHQETFALAPSAADWVATPLDGGRYRLAHRGRPLGEFALQLPGAYNVANACAAVALCAAAGLEPAAAAASLAGFRGVGRRFERRGAAGGVEVIDDYAHHPTEIRAALAGARQRFPGRRLWCIFQPHTFSRTRLLFDDFATALRGADRPIICPVYAAREEPDPSITAERLASAVGPSAAPVASLAEAAALVAEAAEPGDVVLTVGAGDITDVGPRILALRASASGA